MAEVLSAGVFVEEIDGSTIAPTVSNSIGVFAGDFVKGPVDAYMLITTIDELILFYGLPTDSNYSDWYQAYNFLQYGNKLYISRVSSASSTNAVFEAVDTVATGEAVALDSEYTADNTLINNQNDYEVLETSIAFTNATDSKLKFMSRSPGAWGNDIEIAIATPSAFDAATPSFAFTGIGLDDLFEYPPTGTEIGVIIRDGDGVIQETYAVDFDQTAKGSDGKSTYIETVINNQSNLVYVKENTANTDAIKDYCASVDGTAGNTFNLVVGVDEALVAGDYLTAYEVWSNPEEVEIDIVIANEFDDAVSAKALVETRKDCIAFFGAKFADTVGKKAAQAVSSLIAWRKSGVANFNSMWMVACGNYKYQYDRYNDKNRLFTSLAA